MIIGIIGRQGSGKTLFAINLALGYTGIPYIDYEDLEVYDRPLTGDLILSNLTLTNLPKNVKYRKITTWDSLTNKTYIDKETILLLDEAHLSLDARNFMRNRKATHLLSMFRHIKTHLIYTTQIFFQVEYRLRTQTDWIIMIEKFIDHEDYFEEECPNKICLHAIWNRYDMMEEKMYEVMDRYYDFKTLLDNVKDKYDTHEILTPIKWRGDDK